jgi:outer membrane protein TolC
MRSALNAQDTLARSNQTISINLVALYKVHGGGWQEESSSAAVRK